MQKKTVVITGASDGIGAEAARILAAEGHQVVLVGRSSQKTESLARELGCQWYTADFSELSQVRELAASLKSNYDRIDVLANNAGGIFGKRRETADGHEMTMQINHLAHFLLTWELLDLLISSKAVVINTSSVAHRIFSRFDIDDLDLRKGYTAHRAYGNAKLMNILFTKELVRRYGGEGLSSAAFHPGNVATNFARKTTSPLKLIYHTPLRFVAGLISAKVGADTLIWLATSTPGSQWQPGGYFVKRKPAKTLPLADDEQLAGKLWDASLQMVK